MGRARRTLDRKALREQNEAADRQKDEEKEEGEEEEDEDEDDEEGDEDAPAASGEEDEGGGGDDDDDDEDKPKKKKASKKKVVAKKAKAPAKPRTRTAKVVRMKIVWVVYSNSHSEVDRFPYPKKKEAEAFLDKITNDKKSGGPFFLQPVKVPMEKDKE